MQIAPVNGIHVHYRLSGKTGSPLIVFVNSLGTDFRIWDKVIDCLGNGVQTLLYDKRGHGLSDATAPPYTMDDHADDLAGLLAYLGFSKAVICGLSVGGMVALTLAFQKPRMVQGLVLCDTALKIGHADFWDQRVDWIKTHGLADAADSIVARWFSEAFRNTHQAEVVGWKNLLSRTSVAGYVGTCMALRDTDLTHVIKGIRMPVLCLCGEKDVATPPNLVRSMCDLLEESEFQIIDGAGHHPCIESPEVMAGQILQFLHRGQFD